MERPPKPRKNAQGNLKDPMPLKDILAEFAVTDLSSPTTQQSEAEREARVALRGAEWRFQAAQDERGELIGRIVAGENVSEEEQKRARLSLLGSFADLLELRRQGPKEPPQST